MDTMNNTTVTPNEAFNAPANVKIDYVAIKRIVGEAIDKVDGVLGVAGNLTDLLKSNADRTKGLSVTMQENSQQVDIDAKIMTEYGKNIPTIVNALTTNVTEALRTMAGLEVNKLNVEVADTLTREEYNKKYPKTPQQQTQ